MSLPVGPVRHTDQLAERLANAWDALGGSHAGGMGAKKLYGRVEEPRWDPPVLTFRIERHGGAAMGSTRARLHEWSVNVDDFSARVREAGYRQLVPMQKRLDTKRIAEDLAGQIRRGADDERLKWCGCDKVRIEIATVIPDSGPKQTVAGRRKRLREQLAAVLDKDGWARGHGNVFERKAETP